MQAQPRMTKQRRAIFAALQGDSRHPTAEEIYLKVKRQLPHISLGTVYRNLKWLVAQNLVKEITVAHGPARYDFRTDDHQHFLCDACGRVYDLKVSLGLHLRELERTGFSVQRRQLVLYGLCPRCSLSRSQTAPVNT
ncbi:MAG: transcriptional repressor [Candidatus Bipolaricaulota bacterium]|nr:transcriptional repressor [Candidatus Bipolaricaulota bacterium]MCS7275202.1 transcriptional repressor [Candidatus Bipolaricaulota bacterium]MDW8111403.1 transcriptional repressor [Candidatus Bipolaricaulota bacterium]MDW8329658.1 transcriptional repressor [Candidatus Bipolaricaulota bacterium]